MRLRYQYIVLWVRGGRARWLGQDCLLDRVEKEIRCFSNFEQRQETQLSTFYIYT